MNYKEDNKLTQKMLESLKQGDKVEFKWYGSKELYVGRIEVSKQGTKYFVNEFNYKEDKLLHEGMRYYNSLESFFCFTHFKKL